MENKGTAGGVFDFKVFAMAGTWIGRWITEQRQQGPLACHRRLRLEARRGPATDDKEMQDGPKG